MRSLFIILCLAFSSCAKDHLTLRIKNTLAWERKEELASVDAKKVQKRLKSQDFYVIDAEGEVVPFQISYTGEMLIQAGTGALDQKKYVVKRGKSPEFVAKTYARFIPERKDDFAWENDRVAFRLYGPALIATDGPSNGLDIWYKRTPELIIDKWYEADLAGRQSYHEDHGEGLDDYKVGPTLGAGAMTPYVDGKLFFNKNFVRQEILENGPLRTTFRLTYASLSVGGEAFTESRLISLDAGSHLSRISQIYGTKSTMKVAAGLIRRGGSEDVQQGDGFVLYEEPATAKASGVYLGLLRPEGWSELKENEQGHVLALADYQPGTAFTYYAGFGWNKFGFKDRDAFRMYLEKQVQNRKKPLRVRLK